MTDEYGRNIDYLRISVTDRCNLRCVYCMPPEGVESCSHDKVLRYEEIMRIVRAAALCGIKHIRLTGGEPTVRRGIVSLVKDIHDTPGIESVSMTTNGVILSEMLPDLTAAGLSGVNISIDTLDPDRFDEITRRTGNLPKVLEAIDASVAAGLNTKVNCVAMKGVNDDELACIAALAENRPICVRFIEFMPIGKNDFKKAVQADEIIDVLTKAYGKPMPDGTRRGNGPARYYKFPGLEGPVGIISAMTHEFCEECNRIRLTSDGFLKLCLQYDVGESLRELVRAGASEEELAAEMKQTVMKKPQHHTFNDYADKPDIEERAMSSIGG